MLVGCITENLDEHHWLPWTPCISYHVRSCVESNIVRGKAFPIGLPLARVATCNMQHVAMLGHYHLTSQAGSIKRMIDVG